MEIVKLTGLPLAEGLESAADIPHTISYALIYRSRIDSFYNLPKDKRPPRALWDKPYRLSQFLEDVWKPENEKSKHTEFIEWDDEDVEWYDCLIS